MVSEVSTVRHVLVSALTTWLYVPLPPTCLTTTPGLQELARVACVQSLLKNT